MGRMDFLAMKTDGMSSDLFQSDLMDLQNAAMKLADHAFTLGGSLGFGTTFLAFLATFTAIYLLILDRTNWRTNILTSLLVPYVFLSLPSMIFTPLSTGEPSKWITFIITILQIFFQRYFPDWLQLPGVLILLVVVAPSFFAVTVRNNLIGVGICLVISCYLLQEHIRASGGFRNSFTKSNGISNTIGLILLFVYPIWCLVLHFL